VIYQNHDRSDRFVDKGELLWIGEATVPAACSFSHFSLYYDSTALTIRHHQHQHQ
jgi:hypothetical protein